MSSPPKESGPTERERIKPLPERALLREKFSIVGIQALARVIAGYPHDKMISNLEALRILWIPKKDEVFKEKRSRRKGP